MRNRYSGKCYRCGKDVPAGQGHFEKKPGGWKIQHADCAITYRGKKSEYEIQQEELKRQGKIPF